MPHQARALCGSCEILSFDFDLNSFDFFPRAAMKIVVRCPGCAQRFGIPRSFAGKRIKCPKCEDAISVPAPKPKPKPEPEPDPFDALNEDEMPALPSPPPRPRTKTRPKAEKPRPAERRESSGLPVGLLKGIAIGLGLIAGTAVLVAVGLYMPASDSTQTSDIRPKRRPQMKFKGEHGDLRTTAQWFDEVREQEKADSGESKPSPMRVLRLRGIHDFLGPDPAAVPDLLEALAEPSEVAAIADGVLKKFQLGGVLPVAADVKPYLKHEHPSVKHWAKKLMRMLDPPGTPATPDEEAAVPSGHGKPAGAAELAEPTEPADPSVGSESSE